MWFKKKKTEEEIQQEISSEKQKLEKKLVLYNETYKDVIGKYIKVYNEIFILKGFEIEDNKIFVIYKDSDCLEGYIKKISISWWYAKWNFSDFSKMHYDFLKYVEKLKKLGLKLEKI